MGKGAFRPSPVPCNTAIDRSESPDPDWLPLFRGAGVRADWLKRGPDVINDLSEAQAFDLSRLGIGEPLSGFCCIGGELLGQAWRSLLRHARLTPLKGHFDAGPQVVQSEFHGLR